MMAYDPGLDKWDDPCDLCGGIRQRQLTLPISGGAKLCRDCGLVSLRRDSRSLSASAIHIGEGNGMAALRAALRRANKQGATQLLLVGASSLALAPDARELGMKMTALVESGTRVPSDITAYEGTIDSAPFLPDQFEVVLCIGGLESLPFPSVLFERARQWMSSGGVLLIAEMNWRSIAARLWQRQWLAHNASNARYLFTPSTIRRYADRYGYDVRSLHARASSVGIASVAAGGGSLSWLQEAALHPIVLASNIFGMGDEIVVEMVKEGVATRPLLKKIEAQAEQSPGLAPALYTGVRRESL